MIKYVIVASNYPNLSSSSRNWKYCCRYILLHLHHHSHVVRSLQFTLPVVSPRSYTPFHFTTARNLSFSFDQIRSVTNSCMSCQFLKPNFITSGEGTLIKDILLFQLNIDFKGPLPSLIHGNNCLHTVIDEFYHFLFLLFTAKILLAKPSPIA